MIDLDFTKKMEITARHSFRYYSRQVFLSPNNIEYHEKRIDAALLLDEREPLQGALADFLYGCWYDIPYIFEEILDRIQGRLLPEVEQAFYEFTKKFDYIDRNSVFATRWSILVTPSLNNNRQRLRISSDDAKDVANDIVTALMQAKENEDSVIIERIEDEFFAHCISRSDRLAFSLVWFRLGRSGWGFDERWNNCEKQFEQTRIKNGKKE